MTTPDDRDRSLDQWFSAALPETGEPTDSCLDAETVAAWLDEGLAPSARQQAEVHVSTCARCQALVSAVVTMQAADAAATEPVPSRWRAWANWMVPLGAVATAGLALAVWLNIPAQPVPRAGPAPQARLESVPDTVSSTQSADAPAEAAPVPAPEVPLQPRPSSDVARKANAARTEAVVPAPAAPPLDAASAPAAGRARLATPAVTVASAPVAAAQDALSAQAFAAREAVGLVEVTSPDAQVRWRLAGRAVLRSADRGATWTPVVSAQTARLLAGVAPSAAVCWLVGEAGLVLRSVDGVTFVRVTAPAAVDLTAVTATSAANAAVTAADGRRFTTSDGGTTWELTR